jgi:hypothetical protein
VTTQELSKRGSQPKQPSNDYVDITQQHFASDRPSTHVNIGSRRRNTPDFESPDDYVDITKQHFSDRSSFSQLVNSGTKKDGTTYGSWDESRLLPMPERTKDASWRRRRAPNSEYLDSPKFSSDLSPPSLGKPGLSSSRQPLSATANLEPKQRFNTSVKEYRDVVASSDRQPLSATANAATQQRFNTSGENYRDSSVAVKPQPLSSTANASPKQRFKTTNDDYEDSSKLPRSSASVAYAPPRQRFKTSEEGYKNNLVLSGRLQPLNANAAVEKRFKTNKTKGGDKTSFFFSSSDSRDAKPLSLSVQSTSNRFNVVGRKALLSSTKSVLDSSIGIDVPRAFSSNIEMVTVSPGKDTTTNIAQYVDDVRFSSNLASTKVKNITSSSNLEASHVDKPQFSPDLVNSPNDKRGASPRAATKAEPPLSMTVHSTSERFNTTKKSSSTLTNHSAVGFDVPRAFVKNIDMVTKSEAKTGERGKVDQIKFSSNLSASTQVRNLTKSKQSTSIEENEAFSPDANLFSPILSESTSIRRVNYTQPQPESNDLPLVDQNEFSPDLTRVTPPKHKPGTALKSTPHHTSTHQVEDVPLVDQNEFSPDLTRVALPKHKPGAALKSIPHRDDVPLVDQNEFSPDLTRVALPKHKPGAALKSTPHLPSNDLEIDLNQFSSISDLCPPSKPKRLSQSNDESQMGSADRLLDLSSRETVNTPTIKSVRSAPATISDDPFVDVPRLMTGPLRIIKDITTITASKDDIGVDKIQFSPVSKLRPPSQVKHLKPKTSVPQQIPKTRAPHLNPYFQQFVLGRKTSDEKVPQNEVFVDRFLDLSSQHTVNNSSMTALGTHAVMSDDPYVNVPRFSSPNDLSPPSKVKTYKGVVEEDYFDITKESLSSGSLTRNVSSVRDSIASTKSLAKSNPNPSLPRNVSSIRDALSASSVKKVEEVMDSSFESSDDEVKHWLLSRLPHIDSESIEKYAEQLVADGFDSTEMLNEIITADLDFMDDDHKDSLSFYMDLHYYLLAYLPDLEAADIESYSRQLIDDGFDSFEMLDELTAVDVSFMKPQHRQAFARQLTKSTDESTGLSNDDHADNASFDITRDSFPERPSLASDPDHHLTSSRKNDKDRKSISEAYEEEESFDITRTVFPHRQSLAVAEQHYTSEPSDRQSIEKSHDLKSNPSVVADEEDAGPRLLPKAELYQFYIDKGLYSDQASDLNDFYTVWENEASPNPRFTCVFTCLISGEHFLAGSWKGGGEIFSDGQLYWYRECFLSMCVFNSEP